MILIIHANAQKIFRIFRNKEEIDVLDKDLNSELIRAAQKYPEEIILWVERKYQDNINFSDLQRIFHHDLIMCSFAVENQYLPETIGYIDQWPFVNPDYKNTYPTWRMSTDMGGIKGKILLAFKFLFRNSNNLGYNLNSLGKLGQQNGLFCYSEPRLLQDMQQTEKLIYHSDNKELFRFVQQHYKWQWGFVLFFCLYKYESKLPLRFLFDSFFSSNLFKKNVPLETNNMKSEKYLECTEDTIDVVIPTLGRPDHLRQVLSDLTAQTHLPKKVIVVEQNSDPSSKSELPEIKEYEYPFEVNHQFIHISGACNARNMALNEVTSNWVFFADDDIRLSPDFLKESLSELNRLGLDCLNINCKQPGQVTVFHKIKQWGSFGAGTSIVNSRFAKTTRFSEIFENGYGEDQDYGMQLRKKGCDIIYHPGLEITHLKAPVGGFRNKEPKPWEKGGVLPKPSPTLMVYAKKYFSKEQLFGFKVQLFLRYYPKQEVRNPETYIKIMKRRWNESEKWAEYLQEKEKRKVNL